MITNLTLNYDLNGADIGYVIGDHAEVKPGDQVPLYIPKLLSSIEKYDEETKNIVSLDSPSYIFSNAKECRPMIRSRLKTRNYIMGIAQSNSDYTNGLKDNQKVSIFYGNDSLREIYFNTNIKNEERS